jgi:putative ABC transport system permease protein
MSISLKLAFAGLWRTPVATLVRVLVLGMATALLGSMILFVGHSLNTMTGSAVRSVPLDWQGPVSSYAADLQVAAGVARQPGVLQASPAATAPLAGATHRGAEGLTATGAGAVLAVPRDYLSHLGPFRLLQGSLLPGGVVLDQQMAATLQAKIGDLVALTPSRGARPLRMRVSGVALVSAPDVLFAPLDPQAGPAPAQPPANIAVMELGAFATKYAPALTTITPASVGSSAVPGALDGVQWQVHAQLDSAALNGSPAHALTLAERARNRVERSLPGQVRFVDNLHETLTTAAGDALYAIALYIMLAIPGALIALGLVYLAALGSVERDRGELALLRARGARRRDVLALAIADSAALGLLGGLLGAGLSAIVTSTAVSGGAHLTTPRAALVVGVCVALAFLGAACARMATSVRALLATVADARQAVRRERAPLWRRLGLDFLALALSGLIYWLTARTGFSAVVNPDSNPTLSLAVYMFFAPALLWIGVTLLLVRARGRLFGWLARRFASRNARGWGALLLASAGRRGEAINRGLIVLGLLLAFGVSLGVFTATYDQQANIDARLTLGGDVTVTAPPGAVGERALQSKVARVPGVASTTAVDHSYAYVGPDLQDTYGIDARTIAGATSLRDSYFLGAGVSQTLARLRAHPDGILVSKETIGDYSLALGDLLKLRVLNHGTGRFAVVSFHVAGIVQEFPSAPRDSFMVANLSYLQAADHGGGPNVIFAATTADPASVARRVAAATSGAGTSVKDIRRQAAQTASSITAVDLGGIRDIEEIFAIALAAAAMALFVGLALSERRRELAMMAAVGAPLRRIAAFLWSEAALVLILSLALAASLGLLLSLMLIAMLQHVFDPPPDHLAIPWGYLGGLAASTSGAAILAVALAAGGLRRLSLGTVLRES